MLFRIFEREVTRQFIKFCLVGLECTILNYLIFVVLFKIFFLNYLLSAAIGFIVGVLFGFIFNRVYTFRSDKSSKITLPKYFFVYLISLVTNLLFLRLLVVNGGISPLISNALMLPITTLINFLGTKVLAFQNKKW